MSGATLEAPERAPARRRLGVGAAIVVVIAALAVSVGIGVFRSLGDPQDAGEPIPVASTAVAMPTLYVHVAGAVTKPGLYRLDDGARVVDAIAAAGGLTADADAAAVNLARRVTDGEQLQVPVVGAASEPAAAAGGAPGVAGDGRVNLNTADVAALDTLPRVGPAIAQRIVDWRDENGPFTSVDDLLSVPGIGDKMLAALRELVTV